MNNSLKEQLEALKSQIITKKEKTNMACGDKKTGKPSPKPKKAA